VNRTPWLVCLFALWNLTLFAQAGKLPRTVHTTERSGIHVPPQSTPEALEIIYSNLGKEQTDLYNDSSGWLESGPNSDEGGPFFDAMPFTPKSDSHVSQARVAMEYGGSGANQVNLSIYGDSGGVPGTLLAGPVTLTNLPDVGTCCTLAIADFAPIAVNGGTQYWVVADTPLSGVGSDFFGVWDYVPRPTFPQAFSQGFGWAGFNGTPEEAAGAVLGKIP
jgi:hypothetical protein